MSPVKMQEVSNSKRKRAVWIPGKGKSRYYTLQVLGWRLVYKGTDIGNGDWQWVR